MPATAIEFDFEARKDRCIAVDEARAACDQGRSCWIDLDASDRQTVETILTQLGVNRVAIDEALSQPVDGRHDVYQDCLHVGVACPRFVDGKIQEAFVDLIIAERFLVTLRRGRADFLDNVRRNYQQDFVKFARTLGFMLYEIWDHLLDSYRRGLREIENEVERVQARIFGEVDDRIFNQVAEVMHNLLLFRKNILAAREVLRELAVRRSSFVSESTQPFLDNMAGTLERLGSDLTVEREVLAETLNLHLGIVSHRTNRVVTRLTVLSAIFLPLTFLCGVYGMNFDHLPEVKWRFGYLFFWLLAGAIAAILLGLMKVKRWL
jgi:magnesium transporter